MADAYDDVREAIRNAKPGLTFDEAYARAEAAQRGREAVREVAAAAAQPQVAPSAPQEAAPAAPARSKEELLAELNADYEQESDGEASWAERYVTAPLRRGYESVAAMPDMATGDYKEFAEAQRAIRETTQLTEEDQAFLQSLDSPDVSTWDALTALVQRPSLVTATLMESLPVMVAPLIGAVTGGAAGTAAGTAIGGPPGAAAGGMAGAGVGAFAGSFLPEYLNSLSDFAQEKGIDLTDEAQLQAFYEDPELLSEARDFAAARGIGIAVFDTLSLGLAGRFMKFAKTARTAGRTVGGGEMALRRTAGQAVESTMQGAAGGAGEASARALAGQEQSGGAVAQEILAEVVAGVPEQIAAPFRREPPAATPPPPPGGTGDPAADAALAANPPPGGPTRPEDAARAAAQSAVNTAFAGGTPLAPPAAPTGTPGQAPTAASPVPAAPPAPGDAAAAAQPPQPGAPVPPAGAAPAPAAPAGPPPPVFTPWGQPPALVKGAKTFTLKDVGTFTGTAEQVSALKAMIGNGMTAQAAMEHLTGQPAPQLAPAAPAAPAAAPAPGGAGPVTAPEPMVDLVAQVDDLLENPNTTRRAVYVGAQDADRLQGVLDALKAARPDVEPVQVPDANGGVLITLDPAVAQQYQAAGATDEARAAALGYAAPKSATPPATAAVVSRKTPKGAVVQQQAVAAPATPAVVAEQQAAAAPGETVTVTTPEAALAERAAAVAAEQAAPAPAAEPVAEAPAAPPVDPAAIERTVSGALTDANVQRRASAIASMRAVLQRLAGTLTEEDTVPDPANPEQAIRLNKLVGRLNDILSTPNKRGQMATFGRTMLPLMDALGAIAPDAPGVLAAATPEQAVEALQQIEALVAPKAAPRAEVAPVQANPLAALADAVKATEPKAKKRGAPTKKLSDLAGDVAGLGTALEQAIARSAAAGLLTPEQVDALRTAANAAYDATPEGAKRYGDRGERITLSRWKAQASGTARSKSKGVYDRTHVANALAGLRAVADQLAQIVTPEAYELASAQQRAAAPAPAPRSAKKAATTPKAPAAPKKAATPKQEAPAPAGTERVRLVYRSADGKDTAMLTPYLVTDGKPDAYGRVWYQPASEAGKARGTWFAVGDGVLFKSLDRRDTTKVGTAARVASPEDIAALGKKFPTKKSEAPAPAPAPAAAPVAEAPAPAAEPETPPAPRAKITLKPRSTPAPAAEPAAEAPPAPQTKADVVKAVSRQRSAKPAAEGAAATTKRGDTVGAEGETAVTAGSVGRRGTTIAKELGIEASVESIESVVPDLASYKFLWGLLDQFVSTTSKYAKEARAADPDLHASRMRAMESVFTTLQQLLAVNKVNDATEAQIGNLRIALYDAMERFPGGRLPDVVQDEVVRFADVTRAAAQRGRAREAVEIAEAYLGVETDAERAEQAAEIASIVQTLMEAPSLARGEAALRAEMGTEVEAADVGEAMSSELADELAALDEQIAEAEQAVVTAKKGDIAKALDKLNALIEKRDNLQARSEYNESLADTDDFDLTGETEAEAFTESLRDDEDVGGMQAPTRRQRFTYQGAQRDTSNESLIAALEAAKDRSYGSIDMANRAANAVERLKLIVAANRNRGLSTRMVLNIIRDAMGRDTVYGIMAARMSMLGVWNHVSIYTRSGAEFAAEGADDLAAMFIPMAASQNEGANDPTMRSRTRDMVWLQEESLDPTSFAEALHTVETLIHETAHAATFYALEHDSAFRKEALRLFGISVTAARAVGIDTDVVYGFADVHEFLAESFSNPEFQALLSQIDAGFPTETGSRFSLWDKLVGLVLKALGIPNTLGSRSALAQVMRLGARFHADVESSRPLAEKWVAKRGLKYLGKRKSKLPSGRHAAGRVHQVLLGFMTLDQIERRFRPMFDRVAASLTLTSNPLTEYFRTHRYRVALAKQLQRGHEALLREMKAFYAADPQAADEMAQFAHDSTRMRVDPTVPLTHPNNAHLWKRPAKNAPPGTAPSLIRNATQQIHADLVRRWNALSQAQKDMYTKSRDYYQQQRVAIQTQAIAANLKRMGATQFQAEAIATYILQNRPSDQVIMQALANLNIGSPAQQQSFPGHAKSIIDLATVHGAYFPLARFGEFVVSATKTRSVSYTDKQAALDAAREYRARNPGSEAKIASNGLDVEYTDVRVHMFEDEGAAKKHIDVMRRAGFDVPDAPTVRMEGLSAGKGAALLLNRVGAQAAKTGTGVAAEQFNNALRQAMIELMAASSMRTSELHRKGVEGATTDFQSFMRTYSGRAYAGGWALADMSTAAEMQDAFKRLRTMQTKARTEEATSVGRVINELLKREELAAQDRDMTSPMARVGNFIQRAGFALFLASPSYGMINATQPFTVGMPYLMAKFGTSAGYTAMKDSVNTLFGTGMKRLFKDLTSTETRTSDTFGPDLIKKLTDVPAGASAAVAHRLGVKKIVMENLLNEGLIESTQANELFRNMIDRDETNWYAMVEDWFRVMPNLAEVMNRVLMASAAYDAAVATGKVSSALPLSDQIDLFTGMARDAIDRTQFDYSMQNRPRFFKWPGARAILMFKVYAQGMYALLLENAVDAVKGTNPVKRAEATKALGWLVVSHSAIAGVLGGVFAEPVRMLISATGLFADLLGLDDDDDDEEGLDLKVRRQLAQVFGETGGEIASRGLLRALGMDVASRTGMDKLLFGYVGGSQGQDNYNAFVEATMQLLGPLGSYAANVARGVDQIQQGNMWEGIRRMVPKVGRDVMDAFSYVSDRGVTDFTGTTVMQSREFGPVDVGIQLLGIQPAKKAEVMEERRAMTTLEAKLKAKQGRLRANYLNAGSPAEQAKYWSREIVPFNHAHPDFRITRESINRGRADRRTKERQAERGQYVESREVQQRAGGF